MFKLMSRTRTTGEALGINQTSLTQVFILRGVLSHHKLERPSPCSDWQMLPLQSLFYYFCVWVVLLAYVCVLCSCLIPMEARRKHQMLCDWSHKWLWAIMWALRTKSVSYGRTDGMNSQASYPLSHHLSLIIYFNKSCFLIFTERNNII